MLTLDFFPNSRPIQKDDGEKSIVNQSHLNHRSQQVIARYYETKDPYFAGELALAQKTRVAQILKMEHGIVQKVQDGLRVDLVIATLLLIGLDYLGQVKFYDGGGGMVFRVLKS